jgi:hypothetical protein
MPDTTKSLLLTLSTLDLHPQSIIQTGAADFGFAWENGESKLVILSENRDFLSGFTGEASTLGDRSLLVGATDTSNAFQLRELFSWLKAKPLGTQTSAGFGDRLGLATPGHIRALRAVRSADTNGYIAPIFAQQSIREMTRTERSPQQVMDDALWGVFSEGWQDGFGADADHLKNTVCCRRLHVLHD